MHQTNLKKKNQWLVSRVYLTYTTILIKNLNIYTHECNFNLALVVTCNYICSNTQEHKNIVIYYLKNEIGQLPKKCVAIHLIRPTFILLEYEDLC